MMSATSHGSGEREYNDFYSTDPQAVEDLLRYVKLQKKQQNLVVVMVILSKF